VITPGDRVFSVPRFFAEKEKLQTKKNGKKGAKKCKGAKFLL